MVAVDICEVLRECVSERNKSEVEKNSRPLGEVRLERHEQVGVGVKRLVDFGPWVHRDLLTSLSALYPSSSSKLARTKADDPIAVLAVSAYALYTSTLLVSSDISSKKTPSIGIFVPLIN